MFHYKLIAIILLGGIGAWLLYWNFIDFLTKGLNFGNWDWTILQTAFPSIATGIVIIIVVSVLGVSVLKG